MRICAWLSLAVIGCGPSGRPPGGGGDDFGEGGDGGQAGCSKDAKLVYTIDNDKRFASFDPPTKTFLDLGTLSCPTMAADSSPFSMAVDRTPTAWVVYDSGELFRVDIGNGLACSRTTWASPDMLVVFGMGYSTDQPQGTVDTLFVGGGPSHSQMSYTLATLDIATMSATPIATEPEIPEMTGNANAELWGFFPDASAPKVVRFDQTNGTFAQTFPEPTLAGTDAYYAFAHWGGDYWVFIYTMGETTTVYQVDGNDGSIKSTTPNTGRQIVGAGVSTCAPLVIF